MARRNGERTSRPAADATTSVPLFIARVARFFMCPVVLVIILLDD